MKCSWVIAFLSPSNPGASVTREKFEATVPEALRRIMDEISNHPNPAGGDTYLLRDVVDGMEAGVRFRSTYMDMETHHGWM